MTGTLAVDRLKLLLECNFQTDTISFLTAFVLTKKEKLRQKFFHHCKVCRCIKLVSFYFWKHYSMKYASKSFKFRKLEKKEAWICVGLTLFQKYCFKRICYIQWICRINFTISYYIWFKFFLLFCVLIYLRVCYFRPHVEKKFLGLKQNEDFNEIISIQIKNFYI